jgi:para-aminobenzoate synthetase / 4-amino-4-deoxychorismate lyase
MITSCGYQTTHGSNSIVLRDVARNCWLEFKNPRQVVEVFDHGSVLDGLTRVEECVSKQGLYAAGMIAYEAAPAFDPELCVRQDGEFPLLWFGLYDRPERVEIPHAPYDPEVASIDWRASVSPDEYRRFFASIKAHLYQGDTYQVNYTYRLRGAFARDPFGFFARLSAAQGSTYGAFIGTPDWFILSASPELFFQLDGNRIISRPMKGTAARGLTWEQDLDQAHKLCACEKELSENLMIVDMVRNDLGRIAATGSVQVNRLFEPEKYPTLWQMTSTVEAQTRASVVEIFQAMFPAASITGAPKQRAMQIIAGLESTPRRIYTGAIGFMAPGRYTQFNVAIRTLAIDCKKGEAEYGVGGGIVWDSRCEGEQQECRTKARILTVSTNCFDLLETMLWTPEEGYLLLDRHLERITHTAAYFDYPFDPADVRHRLLDHSLSFSRKPYKVRCMVAHDGGLTLQADPLNIVLPMPMPEVALAPFPIDRSDPQLYHKTTQRRIYEQALKACPGYDDVILFNSDDQVTESTIANLVVELDGELVTPPLECGLLPGTCRGWMLDRHLIREEVLSIDKLLESPRIFLINSVRGMYQVSIGCYRRGLI